MKAKISKKDTQIQENLHITYNYNKIKKNYDETIERLRDQNEKLHESVRILKDITAEDKQKVREQDDELTELKNLNDKLNNKILELNDQISFLYQNNNNDNNENNNNNSDNDK